MRRLLPFLSLLSLALWLPMTQHCGLEAAGLLPVALEDNDAHCSAKSGSADDGCELVENGSYKPAAQARGVSAPALLPDFTAVAQLFAPLVDAADFAGFSVATSDLPPAWVVTWQFEHRAALPSRAPSLVIA